MACPFFKPLRLVPSGTARAPLGGIYEGQCEKGGPCEAKLCNFGYARGLCAAFPADHPVDAVRFAVVEGRLLWIFEKDHAPVDHGFAESLDGVIAAQAKVFLEKNQPQPLLE